MLSGASRMGVLRNRSERVNPGKWVRSSWTPKMDIPSVRLRDMDLFSAWY